MKKLVTGKVLFVATVFTHLAAFHIPFMKLLQSWGYEVHAAASPEEGRKEEVEAAGVVCWDIPFVRSPGNPKNFFAYQELRGLLSRECYNLVHVHTPMAAWLGRLAAKRTHQGPVLYTAHGFHFYKGAPLPYWLFYYPAERLAARWTDGLIVMNDEDFTRAKRMGFKEGKNLFFVHGVGVDLDRFSPDKGKADRVRKELKIGQEEIVITYVAEFTPTKNHEMLLRAWSEITRKTDQVQLLLVGDGRLRRGLEREVAQRGLSKVQFLGFRRNVPEILAASDIVVQVSKREGLPRAVMEAMAAGKPVVATDVRGNRDLVEHGITGLLVKLGDTGGLAKALLHLINNPELRKQMGEAGREKIQDYSLDRVIQEMAEIYARYLPIKGSRSL